METTNDKAVRPNGFDEYLGQDDAKRSLKVMVLAAKSRGECIGHVLFSGPPGLGKTSLAAVVANEMGARMVTIHAPTLRKKADLVAILLDMEENEVLFIDEIHSLDLKVEEVLYPVMEDSKIVTVTGEGDAVEIPLPRFTVIAATTRSGDLSQPLRDRFAKTVQMQFYSEAELSTIVMQTADKLDVIVTRQAAGEIARRSRGTPRVANALLRSARDYAQAYRQPVVETDTVRAACELDGIDSVGLDRTTRKYLELLCGKAKPVGINTIASYVGEPTRTLEESVEPYLIRMGFVEKLPAGRVITRKGADHACKMTA